jgi:hypothetical protein
VELSCHHFAYLPESDALRAAFPRLRADARLILEHAEQRGTRTAASNALGRPLLEDGWISFNGRYPNHVDSFTLTLVAEAQKRRTGPASQPIAHSYTRTAHRPYDLPVKAVLLRAHQLAPGHLAIACDDPWDEGWRAARDLLADLFDTHTETSPLTASPGAHGPQRGHPLPGAQRAGHPHVRRPAVHRQPRRPAVGGGRTSTPPAPTDSDPATTRNTPPPNTTASPPRRTIETNRSPAMQGDIATHVQQ